MMRQIAFQWIAPCPNERLRTAQARLRDSVAAIGRVPVLFPAGPEMVKLADILRFARKRARRKFRVVQF